MTRTHIGINLLGAYVHTNRLQFVEFFGKFYEGGGREFKPYAVNTKYYNIKEDKLMKKIGFIGVGNIANAIISGATQGDILKPQDLILYDIDVHSDKDSY